VLAGVYTSAAGMLTAELMERTLAENIANADTPGYKAQVPVATDFAAMLLARIQGTVVQPLGSVAHGSALGATAVDWSPGPLQPSPNPLAAAIEGPGFFAVATPQGIRYTRVGDFQLGAGGVLQSQGDPVLDPAGNPVVVTAPPGTPVALAADGRVLAAGRPVAQVGVFLPPLGALAPAGGARFALPAGIAAPPAAAPRLAPGWVEGSNVRLVDELTGLLDVQAFYASNQRATVAQDHTVQQVIEQVGTVP
jgi:flagellar basal-body rod protein FlgF